LLGNLDPATCLTLLSVALSVVAVACIAAGNLAGGVICFMYAGLCDLFDGFIARRSTRTTQQQAFGLQIDSIADMAAFGVVPAFIGLQLGLTSAVDVAALIFYVCCAAMRLAYFNVHGTTNHGSQRFYTGVPVTYAALIFPILLLVATASDRPAILWLIQAYFWGLGILFVLRLPIPKPGGIYYVIFPLIALVLTIFWGLRL
jgi:CDP-diacylglycerol--serine O-phosphatidyltransferase